MKTKYLRIVLPVLTIAALLCSCGATDSVYAEVTAASAQAGSAVIQDKNVIMSVEGNGDGLSDNSGSEDELNRIADEEDKQTEQENKKASKKYKVKAIKAKVMYAKSGCNIRKGPSTAYKKVGTLKKGKKVTVNGKVTYKGKTWYRLKTKNGTEKYVASSLLTTTKPDSGKNSSNGSSSNSSSGGSKKDKNTNSGKKDKDKNNSSNGVPDPSDLLDDYIDEGDTAPEGDYSDGGYGGAWDIE